MYIILKESSNLPIYEQIVKAIKDGLANGSIPPGEMLPSIRSLARDLQISVITTKRAYEELEKEGLIYSAPGKGFYVKETNPEFLREQQIKQLEQRLDGWMEEAENLGVSLEEMHEMLNVLQEGRSAK